jgi:hypothetical protein
MMYFHDGVLVVEMPHGIGRGAAVDVEHQTQQHDDGHDDECALHGIVSFAVVRLVWLIFMVSSFILFVRMVVQQYSVTKR